MSVLKDWIATIVVLAVVIIIMEALLPNNSIKKYAKFTLNLLIVPVLLTPLIKIVDVNAMENSIKNYATELGVATNKVNISEFDEYENSLVKRTFEENLNKILKESLENQFEDYSFEIETNTTFNDNGKDLTINKVKVYIEEKNKIKKIDSVNKNEKEKEKLNINLNQVKKYIANDLEISSSKILILDR